MSDSEGTWQRLQRERDDYLTEVSNLDEVGCLRRIVLALESIQGQLSNIDNNVESIKWQG